MKKHGITDDIPNIPSNEEDEVELKDGARQWGGSGVGDGSIATSREN